MRKKSEEKKESGEETKENKKNKMEADKSGMLNRLIHWSSFFHLPEWSFGRDRRATIMLFSGAAVLLIGVIFGIAIWRKSQSADSAFVDLEKSSTTNQLPSGMAYRALDGVLVSEDQTNRWPVAVMIDNIAKSEVRDQAGLSAASLVYETYVEGRITRLMAVFAGGVAEKIGPVRSARHYFLNWVSEFDAIYGHEGGSPEALSSIANFGIRDLHQGRNSQYYWRDRSGYAPHNLFTSTELLARAVRDAGLDLAKPSYVSWKYKSDRAKNGRPEGERFISIPFNSSDSYRGRYLYDREENIYLRFFGDQPFTDRNTGEQIKVKNVLVQFVPQPTYLSSGKGRIDLNVLGVGKALMFIDGGANIGTWQKNDRQARTVFLDERGNEIELNRGSTWIAVVLDDVQVEYN